MTGQSLTETVEYGDENECSRCSRDDACKRRDNIFRGVGQAYIPRGVAERFKHAYLLHLILYIACDAEAYHNRR